MPSVILTAASGAPFPLVSGNLWSGQGSQHPLGGVQLRAGLANSGLVHISLSGSTTITSGGFFLSGGGTLDAMPLGPGDTYFVPKAGLQFSGNLSIYVNCDAVGSGRDRIFWEVM